MHWFHCIGGTGSSKRGGYQNAVVSNLWYGAGFVTNSLSRMFSGQTSLGHDFGHLYGSKEWQENIAKPLVKFAEKVYRKSPFQYAYT
jgi:hypothetical protein